MKNLMGRVQPILRDPAAIQLVIDEFQSLIKLKKYWIAFYLLAGLSTFYAAFDTYRFENIVERGVFIFSVATVSLFGCAIIAGFFRAMTGRSALEHADVIPKVGLIWLLIATVPVRLSLLGITGTPFDAGEIVNGVINGLAIFSINALTFAVLHFGPRTLWRSVFHNGPFEEIASEADGVPLYIEADDHYVKMVGDKGVRLVRANLGETSNELGSAGFRCHKSYWVSHVAISEKRRRGRQMVLVLKNGTEIPVGRSFEKQVRSIVGQGRVFADAAQ